MGGVFSETFSKIDLTSNGLPRRIRYYNNGRLVSTTINIPDTSYVQGENHIYIMKTKITDRDNRLSKENCTSIVHINKKKGPVMFKMFENFGDTMQYEKWTYNDNNDLVQYSSGEAGFRLSYHYDKNKRLESKTVVSITYGEDPQPTFCYYFYSGAGRKVQLIYAKSPRSVGYSEISKTKRKKIRQASEKVNNIQPHVYDLKVVKITVLQYDSKKRLTSSRCYYRESCGTKTLYKY